ncbi:IPTL-CTERM sorting domain-containing protein [Ottowia sp.]|uniref:beta strand repeat-containing protein n=1 Tax=Ottowia sp. TaxID=1898956 RepID=UPI002C51B9B4|nr:IPTL-CTERM sorting domain-containing protein [Ottowia sp.]HOB65150.1 IPTL-CTERM sorting domain-containing protein [Ottowia sp.]HQD46619.1 IPTL-CTERM sorting domain-containing protein [Ottowia sp.]
MKPWSKWVRWGVAGAAVIFLGSAHAAGVIKSFSPSFTGPNVPATLTVTLSNTSTTAATSAAITDTFPTGLVVAGTPSPTNSCGGTFTATAGAGSVSLTGGSIPAAVGATPGSCSFTVKVVSASPSSYVNNLPIGALTSSQGSSPQAAQATLTVSSLSAITGSKSFGTSGVGANGVYPMTITLNNANSVPLTGVAFNDTLTSHIKVANPPNISNTCGGSFAPLAGATSVSLSGGTIPATGSCTIKFDYIGMSVTTGYSAGGNILNTIAAGGVTSNEGVTNTAQIQAAAGWGGGTSIVKRISAANSTLASGAASTLTWTVTNFNASTLNTVTFTDTLPTGLVPGAVVGNTCGGAASVSGQGVSLTGGGPVAGGSATCTLTVSVTGANSTGTTFNAINAPANYTTNFVDAVVGAVTPDINTLTVAVTPPITVTVAKAFGATIIPQTGSTTLTITLGNATGTDATITSFKDDLITMGTSAGFVVGYSPAPSTTCTGGTAVTAPAGQTVITATGGIIPANGSCTITVPIYLKNNGLSYGFATNTVPAGNLVTSVGNNQAPATAGLNGNQALRTEVVVNRSTIVSGVQNATVTFTLFQSAGVAAMSNLSFSQAMPQSPYAMTMVPGTASTTCAGGTATISGTTLSMTGGSMPAATATTGNTCTITVQVTAPAGSSGADVLKVVGGAATAAVASAAGAPGGTVSSVQYANNNGFTLTALNARVDLSKDFDPVTVARGGTSRLNVRILNNNADAIALTGVSITDNLPTGMVIGNSPNPTFTGTGCTMPTGSSITATPGTSVLTLTGASVAAASTCALSVDVVASYAGNIINSIPAGALTTNEGLKSPLPVSATITSTGTADPYVTKTRTSAAVVAGSSVTYSVVFGNNSGDPIAGAPIKDALPAGATSMSWTCSASAGTACPVANGNGAIDALANLPVGATLTYTVTVQLPVTATGNLVNTATITAPAGVTDSDPNNNTKTVTDPITGAAATLTITKTDGSATYTPGGAAVYTIVVGNGGAADATGVSVVDNLPAGVTLSGAVTCTPAGSATCGTVSGSAGTLASGASIPAGAANTLTFSVPVKFASSMTTNPLVNTATATPSSGSAVSASDSDTPALKADLTVSKTASPNGTYVPGQSLNYTITVSNTGLSDLVGVSITDTVPAAVTVSSWSCAASGTGADCDNTVAATTAGGTTNAISLANVNLPAGTAVAISVVGKATASATGDIVNSVTATPPAGVTCTTAPCAKTASVTNTNAGAPVLNIAKSATPTVFAVGATGSSYAITVSNGGTSSTSGTLTVSDPLPTGITATLPATNWGTGWDCSASTASTVTCTSSSVLIPGANAPVINVPVSIGTSAVSPSVNTARVSGGGDNTCPATGAPAAHCQATVSTPVNAPGLTVKKTLQGNLVVGVPTSYLITVTNNGQAPTLAGTISDPIPTGLAIGTLPNGCTAAGQTLTCTIPAGLATGSAVSYTIPVTPDASVNGQALSNTATASGAGDPACPAGINCKDTATGTVTAPQLKLVKSVAPDTLVITQQGSYTLAVTNEGTAPTNAVATVSDTIPAGLTIGALPNGCSATGQAVSCTIASGLGVGGSTSFVIPVTPLASLANQSVTNTAGVNGGGDPGCANGTATASLPARCQSTITTPVSAPQMTIKKTAGTGWAVGVPASYTLEVTNTGSADSFGTITVIDVIPGTLTLGTLPAGCTAAGQQVTCTSSAVLAKGAKISFVIPVTPTAASAPSVSNTATVQGGGDPVCPSTTAANCSSTVVSPVSVPKLQITETANGPWTIGMGGAAYTVTVTNVGPATTVGLVTVNATLPTGLSVGWSGTTTLNGWSCTANGQDVTCTATPNLANGGSATFTFPVNVLAAAVPSVTTPAAVGGGGDPFNGGTTPAAGNACTTLDTAAAPNHCATVTLPIPLSGAVSTVKTLDAGTKTPLLGGQTVTYVLTATNTGGTDVLNYVLNEVVPAGATYTSITGGSTPCSAGAAAGTLCPVTIASVPAGGSASVRISFTLLKTLPSGLTQLVNAVTAPATCTGAQCDAPPTPAGCTGTSCTPAKTCTAGDPLCVATPVNVPSTTPVPTLSEWMLAAMALMLAMMGWRQQRRG